MTYQVRACVAIHAAFGIVLLLQLCKSVDGQEAQPFYETGDQGQVATFTIEKHGDAMHLPVTIEGVTGPFVLDSGASLHVLDERFKSGLGKPFTTKRSKTAGSPVAVELFKPPKLLVGHLAVKNDRPVAMLDLTRISQVLGRDVHGILGAPFFRHRAINFDFDRGIIRIHEASEPPLESWGVAFPLRADSNARPYLRDVTVGSEKLSFLLDTGMNSSVTLAKNDFQRLRARGLITPLLIVARVGLADIG